MARSTSERARTHLERRDYARLHRSDHTVVGCNEFVSVRLFTAVSTWLFSFPPPRISIFCSLFLYSFGRYLALSSRQRRGQPKEKQMRQQIKGVSLSLPLFSSFHTSSSQQCLFFLWPPLSTALFEPLCEAPRRSSSSLFFSPLLSLCFRRTQRAVCFRHAERRGERAEIPEHREPNGEQQLVCSACFLSAGEYTFRTRWCCIRLLFAFWFFTYDGSWDLWGPEMTLIRECLILVDFWPSLSIARR